jgi:hypothetical protein
MRIDGVFSVQNVVLTGISDLLSRLNVGDLVRAQILEITSSELMLRLFDGTTFKASSMIPVDAARGEFLDFQVKSKENNQLFLETVKGSQDKTPQDENEMKKQLQVQGLKINEPNLELAKQMKNHQIPFTREAFDRLTALVSRFKELSPEKAAFLTGNHIPVEEGNVHQLNAFLKEKNYISNTINQIISLLEIPDKEPPLPVNGKVTREGKTDSQQQNLHKTIPEELPVGQNPERTGNSVIRNLHNELLAELQKAGWKNPLDKQVQQLSDMILPTLSIEQEEAAKDNSKLTQGIKAELQKFGGVSEREVDRLTDVISTFTEIKKGEFEKQAPADREKPAPKESLEALKKDMEALFKKIGSPELSREIQIKELHKELQGKLEAMRDAISQTSLPMRESILQNLDNLGTGLKFILELNNHNIYYPIPLRMGESNTSGELYILKRDPRKRKLDPENVTMLLSLNTENMGQIDSLIALNKKNVSLNLRVQEEGVFELIRENHKQLYQRMTDLGYKLVDLRYRLMEEPADLLNAKELVRKEMKDSTRTIDYRL